MIRYARTLMKPAWLFASSNHIAAGSQLTIKAAALICHVKTMDISSLPTLQGRNQNTFSRPPFDRSDLCIHELFAHHALHSPTHPLFAYADDEQKLHYIHYSKAYNAIRRASNIVSKGCAHARITSDTQPVIGILAAIGIQSSKLEMIAQSRKIRLPVLLSF